MLRSVGAGDGRPPPATRWAELRGSPLARSQRLRALARRVISRQCSASVPLGVKRKSTGRQSQLTLSKMTSSTLHIDGCDEGWFQADGRLPPISEVAARLVAVDTAAPNRRSS